MAGDAPQLCEGLINIARIICCLSKLRKHTSAERFTYVMPYG